MKAQEIFNKLWMQYITQNPTVKDVYELFTKEGEIVENDHIAFRTFNLPEINVDALSQPFLKAGYVEKGSYVFEEKKLFAKHFEHGEDKNMPRVFISELKLEEFSDYVNDIAKGIVAQIDDDLLKSDELIFSGVQWGVPFYEIYENLRKESEYAAWLYVNGFQANHFTVSVNALKKYNSIEKVNELIKNAGFALNNSGGEIKGTPEMLLEQSSIKAKNIKVEFEEGLKEVPGCYYEFARRYKDSDGKLFSGFIAKSADKIFESTDNKG